MRRLLVPVLAAALVLTGCTSRGSEVVNSDGVTEWKQPTIAVDFTGPTVDGATFRSKDHRGDVLVVNFWYASCPPCNAEAPALKELAEQYEGRGVRFVGVNISDDRDNAGAFERQHRVPYTSILDEANGGAVRIAFQKAVPPRAIPSTIVIDGEGRVASRIVGAADRSVLNTLIGDALDEGAA